MKQYELFTFQGGIWVYWNDTHENVMLRHQLMMERAESWIVHG